MIPKRFPQASLRSFATLNPLHTQQLKHIAGTITLVTLMLVSIRLTMMPDYVLSFNHMGYVGGLLINTVASATVLLPMHGTAVTLALAPMLNPLGLAIASGIGCALGEIAGYLVGFSIYALIGSRYRPQFAQIHATGRRFGPLVVFLAAVAPTPLFDIIGILAGLARVSLWLFLIVTSIGKSLKYYFLFSLIVSIPYWHLGMTPASTPFPINIDKIREEPIVELVANNRAQSVETQFRNLQHHGAALAFHLGIGSDPRECRHYQGIGRTAALDGTPLLFLTQSGSPTIACPEDITYFAPAEILVVQMMSRNRTGESLNSNRLQPDLAADDTQPPNIDRGVAIVSFDGKSTDRVGQIWPKYWHAGGTQLIENVLVVPLECCQCGWMWLLDPLRNWVRRDCIHRSMECPGNAGLALIDVGGFDLNRTDSAQLKLIYHQTYSIDSLGIVAVTKTPDRGTYLFAFTWGDSSILRFAESDSDNLRSVSAIELLPQVWHADYLSSGTWRAWQMLNFVNDAEGNLYLFGTDNDSTLPFTGQDWITLFRFDLEKMRTGDMRETIHIVQERPLLLSDPNMGDLDAAAGLYVSPTGNLILYTADHDNEGPVDEDQQWVVEMGEFSVLDRQSSIRKVTTDTGWLELCAGREGWSDTSLQRCMLFTASAHEIDDWDDLALHEHFDDEIESVRWFFPAGVVIGMYRLPHYIGEGLYLKGTGTVEMISDLRGPFVVDGRTYSNWQNDIESVQLLIQREE